MKGHVAMRRSAICFSLLVTVFATPQVQARGCKPNIVTEDKITKERVEIWTQVLSETSFMGSLWGSTDVSITATVGRYGSVNAINIVIQKKERSAEKAAFDSAYRAAIGQPIYFGVSGGGTPVALVVTDVSNDSRIGGFIEQAAVTTVVLSAALSNYELGRLRDTLTSKPFDALRVNLAGNLRIEKEIDEDYGEELMGKFRCFYQALDDSGVNLSSAQAPAPSMSAPSPGAAVGRYVRRGSANDVAELRADGTFSFTQNGRTLGGTYTLEGDTIILRSPQLRGEQRGRVVGNTIVEPDGSVWEGQPVAPAMQPSPPRTGPQLTIDQIIAMVGAKIPDDVIVTTIKNSSVVEAVTPENLIKLKKAGVSDVVLRAMTP